MKIHSISYLLAIVFLLLIRINLLSQTVSTIAVLNAPDGIVYNDNGVLYASKYTLPPQVGDVYRITLDGNFTSYVENQQGAADLKFDSQGDLYFASFNNNQVKKIVGVNQTTTFASSLNGPVGLVFDSEDNLFVMNDLVPQITRITSDGTKSTYATIPGFGFGSGITIDPESNLYACSYSHGNVYKIDTNGEVTLFAGTGAQGLGFVLYSSGVFYATSLKDHKIYKITMDGVVTSFAGNGTPGHTDGDITVATFTRPNGITASESGDTLFIAEQNNIRMIVINGTTSLNNIAFNQPENHRLNQNYPNPFNPSTSISYSISEASFVTLKVYDAFGNEVKTLVNNYQYADNYLAKLSWENMSSGVYFYNLIVGNSYSVTKKMLYLK